ncbi:MAG: type IV pilus modification protein PilV [Pseudomonadota bacterium]
MPLIMRLPLTPPRQAGFSLLEILVSIVVISLGLLGLAGLQAANLRDTQTSYLRSLASQLALDMADRMRVNLTGVQNGDYNDLNGDIDTVWATRPELVPECLDEDCTAADLATEDYRQWRAQADRVLPNGGGTVCLTDADEDDIDLVYPCENNCVDAAAYDPNLPFIIQVEWTERTTKDEEATGSRTQGFCTAFRP